MFPYHEENSVHNSAAFKQNTVQDSVIKLQNKTLFLKFDLHFNANVTAVF